MTIPLSAVWLFQSYIPKSNIYNSSRAILLLSDDDSTPGVPTAQHQYLVNKVFPPEHEQDIGTSGRRQG